MKRTERTLDMTWGRPMGLLVRFALPLILSSLLQQLYTLCDSVIVGQMLGTVAFTATSSAGYLNWFPVNMLMGAIHGFAVALAQSFGGKRETELRRYFAGSIVLGLGLGCAFASVGLLWAREFLLLLKTPAELMDHALRYLRVVWLGFSVTAILNIFTSALMAMGDSRTPLVALALSSVVNILLDYVLMAWLGMDVEGAALATVMAQFCAALWCCRVLVRGRMLPRREDFRLRWREVKNLLRLGIPPLLSNGIITSGELLVQTAVNSYGMAFVTGMNASRRYLNLVNVVGGGLEGALVTFVGQNWGADRRDRIREGTRCAVRMGAGSSLTIGAVVWILAEGMIRMFVPDGTAEMVRVGMDALRVMAMYLIFLYLLCEYRAAIRGMGNTLIPALSGVMELVLRIGCTLLLPLYMGREALYYADAAAWVPTTVMLMVCYYRMRSKYLKTE